MSFQPVVPGAGLVGWSFLQNTMQRQTEVFNKSPSLVRDTDYFEAKIADIRTADDLMSDRRLLRVALGAFGLQDDIDSRAFIHKILTEGTRDEGALANRMTDTRYRQLAETFGFDRLEAPRTTEVGFGRQIVDQFRARSFEIAVGEQDQALRLALNATRELPEIAEGSQSERAKWFTIMGTQPLRQVFETALGLPAGFGNMDLDRQFDIFRHRTDRQLGIGSLDELSDPQNLDRLIERFLLMDQISTFETQAGNSVALTLLQSVQPLQPNGF